MKTSSLSIVLFILILFVFDNFSTAGVDLNDGNDKSWLKRFKTRKIYSSKFALDSSKKNLYPQPFLTIHAGISYSPNSGNVQLNSGQTPGTKINIQDLGFPKIPILFRGNVIFNFGNFYYISFDTYNVNRRGDEVIDKDIKYGDTTFLAGNKVKSRKILEYANLSFINFFYDNGRSRAAYLVGISGVYYSLKLTNKSFPDFIEKESVFVPLPTIGINASTYLNKRLLVLATIKYSGWWSKNYSCSTLNINPYFEYYLYKNFGVGMRYNGGFTSFKKLPEKKFNGYFKDNVNAISVVLVYRFLKKTQKGLFN